MPMNQIMPFNIICKPVGPACNLDCTYCYYKRKKELFPSQTEYRMSLDLLELYIEKYISQHPGPVIDFLWQGGEPTLLGIPFFQKIIQLQQKYIPPNKSLTNALQTNGTLLDDQWCKFFADNRFLVGISIDGPEKLHDYHRVDWQGRPSYQKTIRGLELLQKYQVEHNVLCVVNSTNVAKPLDVYSFFKAKKVQHIQFIPLVEADQGVVSSRSVAGIAYGHFLAAIFDQWVNNDVGKTFVQIFEACFALRLGYPSPVCNFAKHCGRALALEHNGDLFSCDHYVSADYLLGNITQNTMEGMLESPMQKKFGTDKSVTLPQRCQECDVLSMCNGGCPKNRHTTHSQGESGLNSLCEGYQYFFRHVIPTLDKMVDLWNQGLPPWDIMQKSNKVGRNDLCPCGSGQKYKKCCMPDRQMHS